MNDEKRYSRTIHVFSIIARVIIFFNLLSFFLFYLYLIGNFQQFLDTTQHFILSLLRNISLLSGIVGAYYIAILIITLFLEKRFYLFRFILTILSIIFNFFVVMSLKFIISWL